MVKELWLLAAGEAGSPPEVLTSPTIWSFGVNLGAVGLFVWWFFTGKLHSNDELNRVEEHGTKTVTDLIKHHEASVAEIKRVHAETLKRVEDAHAAAMERADDQVRQIMLERDGLKAELNQAVAVMRDFTMRTGAVLAAQPPPWWQQPPPGRGGPNEPS